MSWRADGWGALLSQGLQDRPRSFDLTPPAMRIQRQLEQAHDAAPACSVSGRRLWGPAVGWMGGEASWGCVRRLTHGPCQVLKPALSHEKEPHTCSPAAFSKNQAKTRHTRALVHLPENALRGRDTGAHKLALTPTPRAEGKCVTGHR